VLFLLKHGYDNVLYTTIDQLEALGSLCFQFSISLSSLCRFHVSLKVIGELILLVVLVNLTRDTCFLFIKEKKNGRHWLIIDPNSL
jgi:hypothetical protein